MVKRVFLVLMVLQTFVVPCKVVAQQTIEIVDSVHNVETRQSTTESHVQVTNVFPLHVTCEMDLVRIFDLFGFRVSAGKEWGGYFLLKFSHENRVGFNADELGGDIDFSKKTSKGRMRNSYMIGVKRGVIHLGYPIYAYLGVGYGEEWIQRSSKKKGEGNISYYTGYSKGFESELGANFVLLDFLSVSMGADFIFGSSVAIEINCTVGLAIDPTKIFRKRKR